MYLFYKTFFLATSLTDWALNCYRLILSCTVYMLGHITNTGHYRYLSKTSAVSQHMHKITNLWKLELNRSSNLRENNERKLCAFRWLISRPQVLNVTSQIRGKLLLFRKLCYFRGSRFSHCFKPSTSPHYSSPS